jgi:ABC-type lipoprotein release transport system permease subunit
MLMAVTERFKEIGTMKCLGALNRFIVTLFFIEAGLMGVLASISGWFTGWAIICVLHLFSDGPKAFTAHMLAGSLVQMLISCALGVVITLLAAIPPAVNAARMPPAVALRAEI